MRCIDISWNRLDEHPAVFEQKQVERIGVGGRLVR